MPCHDADDRYDRKPSYWYENARNDELARENCLLRETVIKLATAPPGSPVEVDKKVMQIINDSQSEHRKEDLRRLEKVFREKIAEQPDSSMHPLCNYYEMLGRVLMADHKKPLEIQLGFDPDKY